MVQSMEHLGSTCTHTVGISIKDVYFVESRGSLIDSLRESFPRLVKST